MNFNLGVNGAAGVGGASSSGAGGASGSSPTSGLSTTQTSAATQQLQQSFNNAISAASQTLSISTDGQAALNALRSRPN